ncbi:MAG: hypothetical protein P0S95_06690 [Rhabdochlamydiaceae bacterium]|nr:hypothetical protein [Candidatus Amphrikana amoebophyrae]
MASSSMIWESNLTTMMSCDCVSKLATEGDKLTAFVLSTPVYNTKKKEQVNDVIRKTLEAMESYSAESQSGFELILRNRKKIYAIAEQSGNQHCTIIKRLRALDGIDSENGVVTAVLNVALWTKSQGWWLYCDNSAIKRADGVTEKMGFALSKPFFRSGLDSALSQSINTFVAELKKLRSTPYEEYPMELIEAIDATLFQSGVLSPDGEELFFDRVKAEVKDDEALAFRSHIKELQLATTCSKVIELHSGSFTEVEAFEAISAIESIETSQSSDIIREENYTILIQKVGLKVFSKEFKRVASMKEEKGEALSKFAFNMKSTFSRLERLTDYMGESNLDEELLTALVNVFVVEKEQPMGLAIQKSLMKALSNSPNRDKPDFRLNMCRFCSALECSGKLPTDDLDEIMWGQSLVFTKEQKELAARLASGSPSSVSTGDST